VSKFSIYFVISKVKSFYFDNSKSKSLHLVCLFEYICSCCFSISLLEFSEVVDPKIASSLLAMFLAFYCNLDKDVNKEQQVDGILQTLISQSKDHKGNLASITTGILYIQ